MTIDLNLEKFLAWAPSGMHLEWLLCLMEKGDVVGSYPVFSRPPVANGAKFEYGTVAIRTAAFSAKGEQMRVFATEDEVKHAIKEIDKNATAFTIKARREQQIRDLEHLTIRILQGLGAMDAAEVLESIIQSEKQLYGIEYGVLK